MSNKSEINFQNGLALVLAIDAFKDAPSPDPNYPYHFWHYSDHAGILANCDFIRDSDNVNIGFISKQGDYDIYVTTGRSNISTCTLYFVRVESGENYPGGTGYYYSTHDFVNWQWVTGVSYAPFYSKDVTYNGHTVEVIEAIAGSLSGYHNRVFIYDDNNRPKERTSLMDWLGVCFIKHHWREE